MKYRNSQKDISLRNWFLEDYSHAHLRQIEIVSGKIRGLTKFSATIEFPIIAIAGKNGSGKSTLLALSCCAYHNKKDGFKANNKKRSYYTFADFFIQHKNESSPKGIYIKFYFAHNNWRITPENPDKKGIKWQMRRKTPQGKKWNEYASRIPRDVAFIGIERIVPHSEKSQSKSYNRYFTTNDSKDWECNLGGIIGYILNKKYDEVKIARHSKYKLPVAIVDGINLSGFNMGAGENALFEIFSTIYSAPLGSLIVIDEIELGLHVEAQARFMRKLKEVCLERKIQIICTTHSSEIFDHLPEDARLFIERIDNQTVVTTGYSSDYAFSKLSSENSNELCILVEDDVAFNLLTFIIPNDLRSRINIEIIGSASAVSIQLAATHKLSNPQNTIAIFDGDQKKKETSNRKLGQDMLEIKSTEFAKWFSSKSCYLPGETWPESWILESCKQNTGSLSQILKTSESSLNDIIEYGLQAGKHNEFHEIGRHINMTRESAMSLFCLSIAQHQAQDFDAIINLIKSELGAK